MIVIYWSTNLKPTRNYSQIQLQLNTSSKLFYQNYCGILPLRKLSHKSVRFGSPFLYTVRGGWRGGGQKRTPGSNGLIFSLPIGNYAIPLTLLGLPFTILYGISPAFTTRACFIQVSRVWSWKQDIFHLIITCTVTFWKSVGYIKGETPAKKSVSRVL